MRPNNQRRHQRGRTGKPNKFPSRNQSYDSNGPDVRVRGTAHQIYEKYQALAREATASGDRIQAESYYQYAEHYYRIIAAQGGFVQPRFGQSWEEGGDGDEGGPDGGPAEAGQNGQGGFDPTAEPQPTVEYPRRGGDAHGGEEFQRPREGYAGGDGFRGRDDNRGGDGNRNDGNRNDGGRRDDGRDRGYDQRQRDDRRNDGRRDDGRRAEGGGRPESDRDGNREEFGGRGGGRRDFVTRAEQRQQERQAYAPAGNGAIEASMPSAAGAGAPDVIDGAPPAAGHVIGAAPVVGVAPPADGAEGDGRNSRDGRPFRPRHPHFRRFRGGARGDRDPALEDQPDITGGAPGAEPAGGTGTGSGGAD